MAGRWMDERERERRYGRSDYRAERQEPRSFDWDDDQGGYRGDGGYEGGRDKVFGERETGASYGGPGATQRYSRSGWQDADYQGESPAMRRGGGYGRGRFQGGDDLGGGPAYGGARYGRYAAGGRFYGDDARERVYREEYGEDRYPRDDGRYSYATSYSPTRAQYHRAGYGEPGYGGDDYEAGRTYSGGTGGYDYERGYGDAGRNDERTERSRSFERAGRNAGDFLHRAGERMANWFVGGSEARAYDRRYEGQSARGIGPKGYKRSDERISDDAHERLTDDHWVDASNIAISVSGGEVTLSGMVVSREAKHRAERIVEEVSGVAHVQNNLRVAGANPLTSDSTGYGDTVAEAQMRRDPTSGDATKKN